MSLQHYSFVSLVFDVDLPLMIPVIYLSTATMTVLMYGVFFSTDAQRHAPVLQKIKYCIRSMDTGINFTFLF